MNEVFVITQSDELARSLSRYFRYTLCIETFILRPSMASDGPQHLVIHSFQRISNWIELKGTGERGVNLRNALVFIDLFDQNLRSFCELDPLAVKHGNWSATVAMLILAFPEVHWVFNTPYRTLENSLFRSAHLLGNGNTLSRIMELREAEYSPLFDPSGLRLSIRKKTAIPEDSNYVPVRHHVATAIDEEDDYAYFNGYMAYRLGYRCHVICSFMMMTETLSRPDQATAGERPEGRNGSNREHVELIFEDLFLNFPDHKSETYLFDLRERSRVFKGLDGEPQKAQYRVFVTVGHEIGEGADPETTRNIVEDNKKFKEEWVRNANRKIGDVLKPVSGFFHLWEESGFRKWSNDLSCNGYASDYVWPPLRNEKPPDLTNRDLPRDTSPRRTFYSGHSAPGRLLEIAERLLHRTQLNLEHVHTVPEAVYGSTLALEAQEYLGHRTPTTSLQALALKHRYEVTAECLFYGVAQNKEVKKRFDEIESEVCSIGHWLSPETRKAAQLDAQLSIVSKLMLIFRQNYQFDEEQECLKTLRNLNRELWSSKKQSSSLKQIKSWRTPHRMIGGSFAWLFHQVTRVPRFYFDSLMNSLAGFLLCIVGWIIILSILFGTVCGCTTEQEQPPLEPGSGTVATLVHASEAMLPDFLKLWFYRAEQGFMHAMTTFFGLQPPHDLEHMEKYGPFQIVLTFVAILGGFVHLGIFISHVYSVVSRR